MECTPYDATSPNAVSPIAGSRKSRGASKLVVWPCEATAELAGASSAAASRGRTARRKRICFPFPTPPPATLCGRMTIAMTPIDAAPDDLVHTAEQDAANDREPLLVLEPLRGFLDQHGLGSGELRVEPVGEGHSNVTYAIVREDGTEVIVRRPPRGPLPPSAHDVLREARVLRAVHGQARVPKVLAVSEGDVIGCPFYLMERVQGHVITTAMPPQLDSAEDRRRMGSELVDALVDVHDLDRPRRPVAWHVRTQWHHARGGLPAPRRARRALRGALRALDDRHPLVPDAGAVEVDRVHGGQLQARGRGRHRRSVPQGLRRGRRAAGAARGGTDSWRIGAC